MSKHIFSIIGILIYTIQISRLLKYSFTGILLFFSLTLNATHIVGGELNYRHIPGTDDYEISLTVYRDCYNGIPQLDNPAYVFIYDASNNFYTYATLFVDSIDTLPPTINSPCFIPPTDICYEHGAYFPTTVTLPPSNAGYQLLYQRCCRNNTILNIQSPDSTGATFYAFIPGTSTFSLNSNPVFDAFPPPFACLGIPFSFHHSATDIDSTFINGTWIKDSIVYELCNPFIGADATNPQPSPPAPPDPPPIPFVNWQSPYSLSDLIGSTPPFNIDPQTGWINCTPNTIGQFVIAVCAREFRNGIYLSSTRRDFQLNVVPCPTLVVAAIQSPLILCGSNMVTFQNFSINASSYDWNFDTTSVGDTSHLTSPSFTYPDTGSYVVQLIAHSNINPGCADTATGVVHIYPDFNPVFNYSIDTCTNTLSFTDTVTNNGSGNINSWNWNFGDGGTSSQHNPVHQFTQGVHSITLNATSDKGCQKNVTQQITLPALLSVTSTVDAVHCAGECNGTATAFPQNGTAPYTYQWNDPLLQTTAMADSLCPGNYGVIVRDTNNCADTLNLTITEPPPLALQMDSTLAYCHGACIGSATATVSGGNGGYNYLWNDSLQQTTVQALHLCPGVYSVLITDVRGCTITDSIEVLYSDTLPYVNATTDHDTLYHGQSAQLNALPITSYTYEWNPTVGLNSYTIHSPISTPPNTITYVILVTDTNGCTNSDSVRIVVLDVTCKEPEIFIPNAFSPNNDQQNDVMLVRGNTIEKVYLALYDRWGEKLFETNDQQHGWDGTYKGEKVPPGVYVYYVTATCFDKQEFFKKGNVTLLK